MNKTAVVSGGFGDAINQIAKVIAIYKEHTDCFTFSLPDTNVHWDIHIIYIRDSVDEQILDQAKPLTRDYTSWVKEIVEANGFSFEIQAGDQKLLYEQLSKEHPEYKFLGPNMDYSLKLWEPQRNLYIGTRPSEDKITLLGPVKFKYETGRVPEFDVAIQVRFGEEYPTKTPNACWQDVAELVRVIRHCEDNSLRVGLIGETHQNIAALRGLVTYYGVNAHITDQYSVLLSAKKIIGFAGWVGNLACVSGIPIMRMLWDKTEKQLQVPPFAYNNVVDFDHNDVIQKLEQFLNGEQ